MSDVKRLLEGATPLPWYYETEEPGGLIKSPARIGAEGHRRGVGDYAFLYFDDGFWPEPCDPHANAALIVYAVNRLPDYEAAVEALEGLLRLIGAQDHEWQETTDARIVLRRLREAVPA